MSTKFEPIFEIRRPGPAGGIAVGGLCVGWGARTGRTIPILFKELQLANPDGDWGELTRMLTPEGHWLWLCPAHRKEYER